MKGTKPRIICAHCLGTVHPGDSCHDVPGGGSYHEDCFPKVSKTSTPYMVLHILKPGTKVHVGKEPFVYAIVSVRIMVDTIRYLLTNGLTVPLEELRLAD